MRLHSTTRPSTTTSTSPGPRRAHHRRTLTAVPSPRPAGGPQPGPIRSQSTVGVRLHPVDLGPWDD